MPKKLKLTESQTKLKSELEILHNQIWHHHQKVTKSYFLMMMPIGFITKWLEKLMNYICL